MSDYEIQLMEGEKPFEDKEDVSPSDSKPKHKDKESKVVNNIKKSSNHDQSETKIDEGVSNEDNKDVSHETKGEDEEDVSHETKKDDLELKIKAKTEELTKKLHETTSWGHSKNRTLVNGLNNLKSKLNSMVENNIIHEDEASDLINSFDASKINDDINTVSNANENKSVNTLNEIDNVYKEELKTFCKWTGENLDRATEYYNCFFNNLAAYTPEERVEEIEYIKNADRADGIRRIIENGSLLYQYFEKPLREHGGSVGYINYLLNENEKLKNKLEKSSKKTIRDQINDDDSHGKIKNKNTNSGNNLGGYDSYLDMFKERW